MTIEKLFFQLLFESVKAWLIALFLYNLGSLVYFHFKNKQQ